MTTTDTGRLSPYQGLIPYGEDDAPFFFGRERETRLIIANLFASPLTLLYGASGVGKSSVLRAGVARQLRQRDDVLVVTLNEWQGDAVASLMRAVADSAQRVDKVSWGELSELTSAPGLRLPDFLAECCRRTKRRLLIILDQFEEYFLYSPAEDRFVDDFSKAACGTDAPISFLVSIREDCLAKLDRFEGRIPNLFDNYLRIDHLSRKAAHDAITEPIAQFNRLAPGQIPITIEPELVTAVLNQVTAGRVVVGESGRGSVKLDPREKRLDSDDGEIETPYLQLVMTRLWDQERASCSDVLRVRTLDDLGGAENIVRTHLDNAMAALEQAKQDTAAAVFHYLVTPSGTKIALSARDLSDYAEIGEGAVGPVLEELASTRMRILRGVPPPPDQPGRPRFEIFHDVLAAPILDWRHRYVQAREQAETEKRLALEAEQRLAAQRAVAIEAERQRALEADKRAAAQAQLAREQLLVRRQRWLLVALGLLVIGMVGLTAYAFDKRTSANHAEQGEKDQRKRAEDALADAQSERDTAAKARDDALAQTGEAERQKGEAERQRGIAEKARLDAERAEERSRREAETERNARLGLVDLNEGNTKEGMQRLSQAGKAYEKLGDVSGEVFALNSMAQGYAELGGIPTFSFLASLLEMEDSNDSAVEDSESEQYQRALQSYTAFALQGSAKAVESRDKAVSFYRAALKAETQSNEPDPKTSAFINRRLGDIIFLALYGERDSKSPSDNVPTEAQKQHFQESLNYYKDAVDKYHEAKAHTQEARISRLIAGLLSEAAGELGLGTKGKHANSDEGESDLSLAYYKRAAAAYEEVDSPIKQAFMLKKVGDTYTEMTNHPEDNKKLAADYYKQAVALYMKHSRPDLAASADTAMAKLYEALGQKEDAFSAYSSALESYLQADSLPGLKAANTQQEEPTTIEQIVLLSDTSPDLQARAESYFKSLPDRYRDAAERARVLEMVAKSYSSYPQNKPDKRKAIEYLGREREVWRQANKPIPEARTVFEIAKSYSDLKDDSATIESIDQVIAIYRQINPQELGEDKKPLRNQLLDTLTSAGDILNAMKQKQRAAQAYRLALGICLGQGSQYINPLQRLLRDLGTIYIEQEDTNDAEAVFKETLDSYGKDTIGEAGLLSLLIGDLYAADKRYSVQALSYYDKGTKLFASIRNHRDLMDALGKVSKFRADREGPAGAVSYLTAFANAAGDTKDSFGEGEAREVLADLYAQMGDKPNALDSYQQSSQSYLRVRDKSSAYRALKAASKVCDAIGDKEKAKALSEQADQVLKQNP
jgi:tetratricopeptide (TPR) repeat protein